MQPNHLLTALLGISQGRIGASKCFELRFVNLSLGDTCRKTQAH